MAAGNAEQHTADSTAEQPTGCSRKSCVQPTQVAAEPESFVPPAAAELLSQLPADIIPEAYRGHPAVRSKALTLPQMLQSLPEAARNSVLAGGMRPDSNGNELLHVQLHALTPQQCRQVQTGLLSRRKECALHVHFNFTRLQVCDDTQGSFEQRRHSPAHETCPTCPDCSASAHAMVHRRHALVQRVPLWRRTSPFCRPHVLDHPQMHRALKRATVRGDELAPVHTLSSQLSASVTQLRAIGVRADCLTDASMDLDGRHRFGLLQVLPSVPGLQRFEYSNFTHAARRCLREVLQLTQLRHLSIGSARLFGAGASEFAEQLTQLAVLSHLSLCDLSFLEDAAHEAAGDEGLLNPSQMFGCALSESLRQLTQLVELHVPGICFAWDYPNSESPFALLPRLQVLNVATCDIGEAPWDEVECMTALASLTHLALPRLDTDPVLQDENEGYLPVLKPFKQLQHLELRQEMSFRFWPELLAEAAALSRVRGLCVEFSHAPFVHTFDSAGSMRALALQQALRALTALTHLSLKACLQSKQQQCGVLSALARTRGMRCLDMYVQWADAADVQSKLAGALHCMPILTTLSLSLDKPADCPCDCKIGWVLMRVQPNALRRLSVRGLRCKEYMSEEVTSALEELTSLSSLELSSTSDRDTFSSRCGCACRKACAALAAWLSVLPPPGQLTSLKLNGWLSAQHCDLDQVCVESLWHFKDCLDDQTFQAVSDVRQHKQGCQSM